MTAITSAGTGPWATGGTWVGGVSPGDGDTSIIANAHTVTIGAGTTVIVGASPADDTGTAAIATNTAAGTGVLVIADGATLRFKGPVRMGASNWTIGAGCAIVHDSSGAAVPATANYSWAPAGTGRLVINGTAGNRSTFSNAPSSGVCGGFLQAAPGANVGQVAGTYGSFSFWGTAAGFFARFNIQASGASFTLDNCLLDNCGKISVFDVRLACNYRFKNTSIRSPSNSSGIAIETDGTGNGLRVGTVTGDWRFENTYIEGRVDQFNSAFNTTTTGLIYLNAVFAGTTAVVPLDFSGSMGFIDGNWSNVLTFIRVTAAASPWRSPSGTLRRTMVLVTSGGAGNPHFVSAIKGTTTYNGWIAEYDSNSGANDGDVFQTETAGSLFTVTITNGLALPTPNGESIGSMFNHSSGNAHNGTTVFAPNITFNHNTFVTADPGAQTMGCGGENNTGKLGLYPSVQSNLAYRASSAAGWITKWITGTTPADGVYTTANYNGYWNITGLRYFNSVATPLKYTNPPGVNDINANPNFVDSTRNFLKWAQSVDATVTSWADALNRFSLMNNDSGSIAGFTVAAAYDWIRAGWAPTNTLYQNAGQDGVDTGGIPGVFAPPTPVAGGSGGGGGGGGYYPSIRRTGGANWRKRKWDKEVEKWIDTSVAEKYADLTASGVPKDVRKEAAAIVKPFADTRGVPKPDAVDWEALAGEARAARDLLALWSRQVRAREIQDDDEAVLMGDFL